MSVQPHRFKQYLEGRGLDAAWWEECALDGAERNSAPQSYPWVSVRLGGHWIRRVSTLLRSPLKWTVRAIFLSPLLILLRAALARTNPWASDVVTVAFVVLVVAFFSMICIYVFLLIAGFILSNRRPMVEPPEAKAERGGISLGGLKLPAAAIPLADQRITVRGRVASLGDILPPGKNLILRDLWLTEASPPQRHIEAVDFAVVAEGQQPAVVRLESAPILAAKPEGHLPSELLAHWKGGEALQDVQQQSPNVETRLLTLRAGQEVELTGVPAGEIVDLASFELGGRIKTLIPDDQRPSAPYRSDAARPATRIIATQVSPVWIKVV